MKKKWILWMLLIVAAALLAYSVLAVQAVGSKLQYIVEPTGDVAQAAADLADLAAEWETTQRAWALNGFIQEAAIKTEDRSARGRISMYGTGALALMDEALLHGRMFTDDELASGVPVALLDEQLALALFSEVDVAGRSFTLGGMTFRVIGVVCHTRQVGDAADCGVHIPLLSGLQPEALVVEAEPLPGVGAGVSFSGVCSLWRSGGTFIDLGKEAVGATLWARGLGFMAGAALLVKGIQGLNRRVQAVIAHFRRKLQRHYAMQLLPQMIGAALLLILGYGAIAGLAALLGDFLLQVVYAYPECVPAVPVEWAEISRTFWQVQQSLSGFRELRTPELLRLRYLAGVIRLCSAGVAILLCLCTRRSAQTA